MRIVRVVGIVLGLLFWLAYMVVATPKLKKVKVYLYAPDMGYNESFSYQLVAAMHVADEENKDYELVWVQATEADYIITIVVDKNKLPVAIKEADNSYKMCYQTISVIHIWQPSRKATGTLNLQVDCDVAEMADRAVVEIETAMGVRPVMAVK